ncbi:MAG: polysaccharide deacetylase family protein [Polyangiaceae bacterium]
MKTLARVLLSLPAWFAFSACGAQRESGAPNTGGVMAGGSTSGGSTSTGGTADSSGGAMITNFSNSNGTEALPTPTGDASVPRPSGSAANLKVLDWAGFKAAVSYTFDDANASQLEHYDELQALGVHYTFYLITSKTEAASPVWQQALKDGHELGNHTRNHLQTATELEIDSATTFIQTKFDAPVWTMASPYGSGTFVPLARTRFLLNRGVVNGLIAPNDSTDPFNTYCFIPATGATADVFNAQIDAARTAGDWRIVLVHGFAGSSDGAYQPVSIDEFSASVTHAKDFGDLWIDTMANVGAYWRGQKLFTGVQPVTTGSDTTWTWTLPAHFPPGRVLRVTVDGGTLSQAGSELSWDAHGYYEVALDAGTLTLSP